MELRVPITVLAVLMGVAFVGGLWAQTSHVPGVFSGTVTKVDWVNKNFAVQNTGSEMIFRWNYATQVNGPPTENVALDPKTFKEGINVTVTYREGNPEKIANWIYVKTVKIKAQKGLSLPFECGASVC